MRKPSFETIERKFSAVLGKLSETTSSFEEGEAIIEKDVEDGKVTTEEAYTLFSVYNHNLRIKSQETVINGPSMPNSAQTELMRYLARIRNATPTSPLTPLRIGERSRPTPTKIRRRILLKLLMSMKHINHLLEDLEEAISKKGHHQRPRNRRIIKF